MSDDYATARLADTTGVQKLCPYCKSVFILASRKTCGDPQCQHERKIEHNREYWDKKFRKTGRRRCRQGE